MNLIVELDGLIGLICFKAPKKKVIGKEQHSMNLHITSGYKE